LQLGSTAIGLKTKDGVVLAVEKRVTSPLLVISVGSLLNDSSVLSKLSGTVFHFSAQLRCNDPKFICH
jgi:20S proteasome subunit alpha 5